MTTLRELAAQKEQLIARSELDRVRLTHAMLGVRSAMSPMRALGFLGGSPLRSIAGGLLSYALPAFGMSRARGIIRVAAMAVAVVRVLRRFMRR